MSLVIRGKPIKLHNFATIGKTNREQMENTIIIAGILAFIVAGFLILRKSNRYMPAATDGHHDGEDGTCCGRHTNCSKGYDNSNLYFDDEELDRFKGKRQEEYTEEETEEFLQILYTMRAEEVDTWVHCLQKREIELPTAVKEEILMILQ